jgi:hypothetical protein
MVFDNGSFQVEYLESESPLGETYLLMFGMEYSFPLKDLQALVRYLKEQGVSFSDDRALSHPSFL